MSLDNHRKYDLMMCYECGYMEGRNFGGNIQERPMSNFERLRVMNFNETVAFMSSCLGIDENKLSSWLDKSIA